MARDVALPVQFAAYSAVRGIAGLVQCFPVVDALEAVADFGSLYYRLHKRHRRQINAAVARSFPQWDQDRVAEVAERSVQNMFQIFVVDAVVTPRLILPFSVSYDHRVIDGAQAVRFTTYLASMLADPGKLTAPVT